MARVRFDGPKLAVDYESFLSQHDIVFERPPVRQIDCLLLGNGDLGLQIDPSGSQLFFGQVMKSDVWRPAVQPDYLDHRASLDELNQARGDPQRLKEIGENERGASRQPKITSGPRPLGSVAVTLHGGSDSLKEAKELVDYRQRLSLYDGLVGTHYRWRDMCCDAVSLAHARQNVLVFRYDDTADEGRMARSVILRRKPFADLGTAPSFGADGGFFWIEYVFPDGFTYVMMGVVEGAEYDTHGQQHAIEAQLSSEQARSFTVYVAAVTSNDSAEPLEYARASLARAQKEGYEALLVSHKSWWHDFWSKSFITISDEEAENCWYTGLYLMASCSRGKDMPNEFGPWAVDEERASWGGNYWATEQPQMYWSVFSSNHPELAEPYYRTWHSALSGGRENARALYGCTGVNFGVGDRGGIDTAAFPYRFFESAANVALVFWWGYLCTQDKGLLEEYAYPVIGEALAFYEDLLVEDEATDRLALPTPTCLLDEFVTDRVFEVKNPTHVLVLIRRLLMAGVEAAQVLGVDEQRQSAWQNILSKLPELPCDDRFFLNYEGDDPFTLMLMPCPLSGVFPAKVVDFDDPRCSNTLGEMFSSRRMTPFGCSLNWPYVCMAASWLGEGDRAVKALHNSLSLSIFPNGWASNYENITHVYGRNLGCQPNVAVPSLVVACIDEMLVQSLYEGVVELFKGVPDDWNVRFANLRTVGAFLFSSEKINGDIPYISVTSLRGGTCQIRLPPQWQAKILRTKDVTCSRDIAEAPSAEILVFDTESDHSYLIERTDAPFTRDEVLMSARGVRSRRRYLGLPKEDRNYPA